MTRRIGSVEEVDMLAVEREPLNPFVAAVSNIQHWFGAARIKDDAMRALEFACFLSGASECANVFPFVVVLNDVAGPITITNKDVAIGRHCKIGRAVFQWLAVWTRLRIWFRLLRIAERENFFAIERGLNYKPALNVAQI